MVSLDPIAGHEQRGLRPVLVVSPSAFNKLTQLPVVCPITQGGEFAKRNGFAVPVEGLQIKGVVRCDQPRVLDLAARAGRKVDSMPSVLMDEVLARLQPLFE